MALEERSWWMKGERVAWSVNGEPHTGTIAVPRGDYSYIDIDDSEYPGPFLIANERLRKLPAHLDPKNKV